MCMASSSAAPASSKCECCSMVMGVWRDGIFVAGMCSGVPGGTGTAPRIMSAHVIICDVNPRRALQIIPAMT